MKKLLITSLIGMLITSSFTFAADTQTNLDLYLTLDEVYDLTVANSIDVENADDNIEIAEDDLHDALVDQDDLEWSYNTAEEYMELVYIDEYYPITMQHALEAAQRDKEDVLKDLMIEVIDTYEAYNQKVESLEESEANLAQAQTTYDNKAKELELGLITETDLKSYEISLMQAELSVEQNENSLEQAKYEFNLMIGYPVNTDFKLMSSIDTTTTLDYNITTLVNGIETYNQTLIDLKEDIAEAELKIELINDNVLEKRSVSFQGTTSYLYGEKAGYSEAKDDLEELQDDYADTLNDEIINLYVAFNNLKSSDLSVKISKLSYESAQRAYETAKVKYDLGLITALELQTTKDSRTSSYESYQSAVHDLYVTDLEFQQTIGTYSLDEE